MEAFLQNAKSFLDAMNQLILISNSLGLGLDDRLKDDSLAVINSAKLLTKEYPLFYLVGTRLRPIYASHVCTRLCLRGPFWRSDLKLDKLIKYTIRSSKMLCDNARV